MRADFSVTRLRLRLCAGAIGLSLVSGCGGGGSTSSTPPPLSGGTATPTPPPAPTPAPTATPTPAAVFDTSEFRRSTGPTQHNAVPAWQVGATGKGVAIGIIDTGIDTANPEFAGRISAASADVAGSRGVIGEDDHGTMVALVAAAARDNTGIVGIAWEATLMMMRADSPGTCAADDCTFFDNAIAAGVTRAVQNGAKVINLSLGGSSPTSQLRNAIGQAASAEVVVVVSAGNDADAATPSTDPNQPDPFAAGLRQAGNGNVIIAGSVNSSNIQSAFSNRAGTEADWYLNALGERVCCVYENGALKVTNQNGQQFVTLVSGTSFSAPQIAGAAALLRQAFPNLTAVQVVDLLLRSARDAGAAGTDAVYGRGVLDIAAAFAPQGTTSLASTLSPLPLGDSTGVTSPAMGDAGQNAPLSAMMLDSYQRAYRIQLGTRLQSAPVDPRLGQALLMPMQNVSGGAGQVALAFSVGRQGLLPSKPWTGQLRLSQSDAESARVLAGRVAVRLSPETSLAFGFAQGTDGLIAQVQGRGEPALLIARSPADDFGFVRSGKTAAALRRQFGQFGVTLSAEHGQAISRGGQFDSRFRLRHRDGVARFSAALDRDWDGLQTALTATWLAEDRTILGARLHDAFGSGGADSLFLDFIAVWPFAPGWRLGGAWRQGFTHARTTGLVAQGSRLASNAWSLDLMRGDVFASGDSLAIRLSQPLRVTSGGLNLDLPSAYDYDTQGATSTISALSLTPKGRELNCEIAWSGRLLSGSASASLFYRRNLGHYASLPADKGAAVSWKRAF
jgi:Subtilase family